MKKLFEPNTRFYRIAAVLVFAIPFMFAARDLNNDLWFTMNHGRYILEHGFATVEPFTVHEGLAFSFEKWATCILFYKAYDWFGGWGVYFVMMAMFSVIIYLFYQGCLLFSDGNKRVSTIFAICNMCMFGFQYIRTRPQIFSYVFLLWEVICLEKYARSGDHRHLYWLPLQAFLYMQFHSTMLPIFFIMMLPYLCDFGFIKIFRLQGTGYRKLPLLVTFVICWGAALINPYGVRSVVYLFASLNDNGLLRNISEVGRTAWEDFFSCSSFPFLAEVIYLYFAFKKKEKFPLRYFFMAAGTLVMALYAVRNNAFYALFAGLVGAWQLRHLELPEKIAVPLWKLGGIGCIVATIIFWCIPFDFNSATYGYEVMKDFEADRRISLYTDFNCGSYAEWRGYRCYADPRAEVFLKSINGKEDILAEVWDSMHMGITVKEMQDKYHFDYWLCQKGYHIDHVLSYTDKMELVAEADGYRIYHNLESPY
ncbi:MAG: hypothetical protein II161_01645 [Erysipelotrichaceae bacterium]|nr:hypothetical protein [Erysipelotrichaceae bacterium]